MNDVNKPEGLAALERELRRFSAAGTPGRVREGIEAGIEQRASPLPRRTPWADRCLVSAIAMGVAAAITIAVLLGQDWVTGEPGGYSGPALAANADSGPAAAEERQLLALLDESRIRDPMTSRREWEVNP